MMNTIFLYETNANYIYNDVEAIQCKLIDDIKGVIIKGDVLKRFYSDAYEELKYEAMIQFDIKNGSDFDFDNWYFKICFKYHDMAIFAIDSIDKLNKINPYDCIYYYYEWNNLSKDIIINLMHMTEYKKDIN